MKKIQFLLMACVALVLAACSQPTIDATDNSTLVASIEKVRSSLSETKQAEFDAALDKIVLNNFEPEAVFKALNASQSQEDLSLMMIRVSAPIIDGLTGEQVIKKAQEYKSFE